MPLTEPAGVYRPRHPERTVVYRLFEEHFERYVREYEDCTVSERPNAATFERLKSGHFG